MLALSLDDGNQDELIYAPTVTREALDAIVSMYQWNRFDEYNNRISEYARTLHAATVKKSRLKRRRSLWVKLTRPQKAFYTFLAFDSETLNGGVWQFLFNWSDLSFAALETMKEIGAKTLAKDYQKTLEELVGKARSISELHKRFDNNHLQSEQRWNSFVEGYEQLPSTKIIERYYFSLKYKKEIRRQMSDYIEKHMYLFARIRESKRS